MEFCQSEKVVTLMNPSEATSLSLLCKWILNNLKVSLFYGSKSNDENDIASRWGSWRIQFKVHIKQLIWSKKRIHFHSV